MEHNRIMAVLAVCLMVGSSFFSGSANAAAMEFVTIGDLGNVTNTNGYGSVDYEYQIGKHEVTIAQFQDALGTGYGEDAWNSVGSDAPAASISFAEAAMFCNFLTSGDMTIGAYGISGGSVTSIMSRASMISDGGKFYVIPTQDEWYKAAYYKDGAYSLYANGTSTAPVLGVDAKYGSTDPWLVGSGAVEQNGTYDMMGNIWEWTESAYDGTVDFPVAENLVFWGGGYNSPTATKLRSDTISYDSATRNLSEIGLRVAVIPEPGTISLMSLSTLGLFTTRTMRRRKRAGMTLLPVSRGQQIDDFCHEQVGETAAEEIDYLSVLVGSVVDGIRDFKQNLGSARSRLDKGFWNLIVKSCENIERVVVVSRGKYLRTLDAILARILK